MNTILTPYNFSPRSFRSSFRCARLHIRRSRQNTFYTITDLSNKVVAAISLGLLSASVSRNKRIKRSPATLERVFLKIRAVFRKHSINAITLLLRSRIPRWSLKNLHRLLTLRGIPIVSVENRRLAIHGHLRAPKKPRK